MTYCHCVNVFDYIVYCMPLRKYCNVCWVWLTSWSQQRQPYSPAQREFWICCISGLLLVAIGLMSHSIIQNAISPLLTFSLLSLQPFTHQLLEWSVAHTHWSTPPSRTLWKMLICFLRWVENSHLCLNYINELKGDLINCECYLETIRLLSDKVKSSTNVTFYCRLSV